MTFSLTSLYSTSRCRCSFSMWIYLSSQSWHFSLNWWSSCSMWSSWSLACWYLSSHLWHFSLSSSKSFWHYSSSLLTSIDLRSQYSASSFAFSAWRYQCSVFSVWIKISFSSPWHLSSQWFPFCSLMWYLALSLSCSLSSSSNILCSCMYFSSHSWAFSE